MLVTTLRPSSAPAPRPASPVRSLPFQGDDAAMVAALLRGHPGAASVFHARFARKVHGLIYRLLGPDSELEDTMQDAFVRTLEALPNLRDPSALESFVLGVAVRTARTRLQSRARRAWLRIVPNTELPDPPDHGVDPAEFAALRALYRLLDSLSVDDRMVLVLRHAAGMTLIETAEACHMSLATVKRRLTRAERAFHERAQHEPALGAWWEEMK
ncbi:MAG: sigma-70 family RNA polymerase sigma factor [Polyangiaceae bacterium]|nr:sigma-70 family RNA polymerase sigma factor [Polyangiaceae bacterium]